MLFLPSISQLESISWGSPKLTWFPQLSQVVRVLNDHLHQLQQIDAGAEELKGRVEAAKKETHRLGSNGFGYGSSVSLGSDATEDFYRSYLRR